MARSRKSERWSEVGSIFRARFGFRCSYLPTGSFFLDDNIPNLWTRKIKHFFPTATSWESEMGRSRPLLPCFRIRASCSIVRDDSQQKIGTIYEGEATSSGDRRITTLCEIARLDAAAQSCLSRRVLVPLCFVSITLQLFELSITRRHISTLVLTLTRSNILPRLTRCLRPAVAKSRSHTTNYPRDICPWLSYSDASVAQAAFEIKSRLEQTKQLDYCCY